jgi:hypothetical protein
LQPDLASDPVGVGPRGIEPPAGLGYLPGVSIFVVIKRPGEPANVIEAPEPLGMTYIQTKVGGFIKVFPNHGHTSEVLQEVTLVVDDDGRRKDLPANVEFPLEVVVGPILACVTDEEGYEHGMPLAQAEAVARALDHYAVGIAKQMN